VDQPSVEQESLRNKAGELNLEDGDEFAVFQQKMVDKYKLSTKSCKGVNLSFEISKVTELDGYQY
jgi:hypothetical protein